ncbi:ribosome biogenesis protein BOP1 homolog isoform X2 [Poeciliopsis prolifica]|uniref:ribosome biogenesis protein BOP1 homolog isoform X2 n=1 Tax=Poeciliopsis prolifica TaxID=188132 RepID=UPI002413847B|nr:ribosome biogenesis protein BOP1 homolog isoform X2 [Poeciliopsis prolifica]
MRFLVPLYVVLAVAAFHSALSASLESAEKEEEVTQYDGLTQLQKIDQMEFEAAQKAEAGRMNITEEQSEDSRFLEADKDGSVEEHVEDEAEDESKEGAAESNGAAEEGDAESESESSEDTNKRQRREYPETSTLNCVLKETPKTEMYD